MIHHRLCRFPMSPCQDDLFLNALQLFLKSLCVVTPLPKDGSVRLLEQLCAHCLQHSDRRHLVVAWWRRVSRQTGDKIEEQQLHLFL
ncbi:hypothetical protein ACU686_43025 [Yinghuangia aomiensis]